MEAGTQGKTKTDEPKTWVPGEDDDGKGGAPDPEPDPAPAAEAATKLRTYIVLIQTHDAGGNEVEGRWSEVGRYEVRKPEEALRQAAEEALEDGKATFAAIPLRSWNPTLVGVSVKRAVSIG